MTSRLIAENLETLQLKAAQMWVWMIAHPCVQWLGFEYRQGQWQCERQRQFHRKWHQLFGGNSNGNDVVASTGSIVTAT
jgi:hypothetical protein